MILFFIFYLIYNYIYLINLQIYYEHSFIINGEITLSLRIVFLFLFSRFIDKSNFYRHQYVSMIIIVLMGIVRFIINIKQNNFTIKLPSQLLPLFIGIFHPFIDSVLFFIIKRYMKHKYYSAFLICFIFGIIISTISIIAFIIFSNINCGENDICEILSGKNVISESLTIILLVIVSIVCAIDFLIEIITIDNYSVFHLILLYSFGRLVSNIIGFSENYILEQIIILITFIIDIFAVLIFVEMIILNFCGLNYNIKKNIIHRASQDIVYILETDDDDEDDYEDNIINEGRLKSELKETDNNNDYNDVYI